MYLYQPCLLVLSLYAWAFEEADKGARKTHMLLPLVILALSEWTLSFSVLCLYPSALLLSAMRWRRGAEGGEVLTSSAIGALLSWKAADLWPLLPGQTFLCAVLLLLPILLLCRGGEDRFFACALGSVLFELLFCLKEYMLFSFAVIRLGSRASLSLGAVSMCMLLAMERGAFLLRTRKKHALSVEK